MSWPLGSQQTLDATYAPARNVGLTAAAFRIMVDDAGTIKYLQNDFVTWGTGDNSFAGTIVGGRRATYALGSVPPLPAGCTEILWECTPTPAHFPKYGRQVEVPPVPYPYAIGYRLTCTHVSPNGLVRVTVTPLLMAADGTVYTIPTKPGGAAVLSTPVVVDVYRHTVSGAPVSIASATATAVPGTSNATYEASFAALSELEHYSLTVRFTVDGVRAPPASQPVSIGGLLSIANLQVINTLITNAGQVVFLGTGNRFAVEAGAEDSEDAWEEAVVDGNVTDLALAQFAAPKLAPQFGVVVEISAKDRRPPEAFAVGKKYNLDNHGRGGDGAWDIVDVQPEDSAGGAMSRLTLNRRFQNVLDDLVATERRVEKAERGL